MSLYESFTHFQTPESNPEQLQFDYFELGASSTKLALACLSGLLYTHEIGVTTPDVDSGALHGFTYHKK
jgi:hypothetical protein